MQHEYINTFIVFCYNEAENVELVIQKLHNFILTSEVFCNSKILLIDDASNDGTYSKMLEIKNKYKDVDIIKNEKNLGIGLAILKGISNAKTGYFCPIPGDGQFDISELNHIDCLEANTIYSFVRKKNQLYNTGRKALTLMNRIINNLLFQSNVSDVNWVKVIPKHFVDTDKIVSKTSYIESEIIIRAIRQGAVIKEIPSKYNIRLYGYSKSVSFINLAKIFLDLLTLRINL